MSESTKQAHENTQEVNVAIRKMKIEKTYGEDEIIFGLIENLEDEDGGW